MQVNHRDLYCKIYFFFNKNSGKRIKEKAPCNEMEALCVIVISELSWTAKFHCTSVYKIPLSVR